MVSVCSVTIDPQVGELYKEPLIITFHRWRQLKEELGRSDCRYTKPTQLLSPLPEGNFKCGGCTQCQHTIKVKVRQFIVQQHHTKQHTNNSHKTKQNYIVLFKRPIVAGTSEFLNLSVLHLGRSIQYISFFHPVTGKEYKIRGTISSTITGVIFLIKCP